MGSPGSRAVALGAAFLLLLVALPFAFLYLTSSAAAPASRSALLNLRPFSARCPPAAAPPLRVFMYDLPARFHVGMMTPDATSANATPSAFPAWPPSSGGVRRQHSVEYWMMASLLDGGGAGSEEGREAVRVRDPNAAEAFFVPFFSSLSFNVHGRNMTDPDTEADRLLQASVSRFCIYRWTAVGLGVPFLHDRLQFLHKWMQQEAMTDSPISRCNQTSPRSIPCKQGRNRGQFQFPFHQVATTIHLGTCCRRQAEVTALGSCKRKGAEAP